MGSLDWELGRLCDLGWSVGGWYGLCCHFRGAFGMGLGVGVGFEGEFCSVLEYFSKANFPPLVRKLMPTVTASPMPMPMNA